jgi:hypothetical protein
MTLTLAKSTQGKSMTNISRPPRNHDPCTRETHHHRQCVFVGKMQKEDISVLHLITIHSAIAWLSHSALGFASSKDLWVASIF